MESEINQENQTIPAGFWQRFFASVGDGIALIIPVAILWFVLNSAKNWMVYGPFDLPLLVSDILSMMISIIILVMVCAYYVHFETSEKKATLGKQALKIIVTDMNGNRIDAKTSAIRFFAKQIPSLISVIEAIAIAIVGLDFVIIGIISLASTALQLLFAAANIYLVGFSKEKRAIHDIIAGTKVTRLKQLV